jgi:hypothetical protein
VPTIALEEDPRVRLSWVVVADGTEKCVWLITKAVRAPRSLVELVVGRVGSRRADG